jgi:hypothetical protein
MIHLKRLGIGLLTAVVALPLIYGFGWLVSKQPLILFGILGLLFCYCVGGLILTFKE